MARRAWRVAGAAITVALGAARADAHLVSTELGPFYDGAAHPFVTPEDLLLVAAIAALAGLRGAEGGRRAIAGLCLGWACAASVAFCFAIPFELSRVVAAAVLFVLGAAAAFRLAPPSGSLSAAAFLAGALHGAANGSAARLADGTWLSILGILSGVLIAASLATAVGVALDRRGGRIALRVAGSWIAAIGLLMAGWQLAGPTG